jgi:type IV pilus assembly protein PilC
MATEVIERAPAAAEDAPHGFNFAGTLPLGQRVKKMYIPVGDEAEAHALLRAAGVEVDSLWRRNVVKHARNRKPSKREVADLAESIGYQFTAGEPIAEICRIQAKAASNRVIAEALDGAYELLRKGQEVPDAFAAQRVRLKTDGPDERTGGPVFPPTFINALRVGQQTGHLDAALEEYVKQETATIEMRNGVVGAMIYPGVIALFGTALILVLMYAVIPKFLGAALSLAPNMELPLLTRITLWLSEFLLTPLGVASVALYFGGIFGGLAWFRTEAGKEWFDRHSIYWPFLGGILRDYNAADLLRRLAMLKEGNEDLYAVLRELAASTAHPVYREMLENVIKRLHDTGKPLYVHFRWVAFLMSSDFHRVLITYERAGNLPLHAKKLADALDKSLRKKVRIATFFVTPALLVILAFFITCAMMACYLPMFEVIGTLANGK